MQTKAKQTDGFLAKKIQVRLNLEVRGRMVAKPDLLHDVIKQFISLLQNAGNTTAISDKGKTLSCVINPKKGQQKNEKSESKETNSKSRALFLDQDDDGRCSDPSGSSGEAN